MKIFPVVNHHSFLSKWLLISLWCILTTTHGYSQLTEDPQITALVDRWTLYNQSQEEMRGWRIQIMASVDRRQMESIQRTFEKRYPEYPTQFVHNAPYWHLKVGAFITIQKAQAFLRKMQKDYPQAIPVTDNLKVEELLLYDQ